MAELVSDSGAPAPLVSVAIVAYNQERVIGACLDSILEQDFNDYEIIVGDDGSTDGTPAILRDYAQRWPHRFALALADRNNGVTANSNTALQLCRGKYIAWMGGDDIMLPGKLRRQVEAMEADPNCVLNYHDLDVFADGSGTSLYRFSEKHRPRSGGVGKLMRHGTFNGACSTMVRRSAVPTRGFDPRVTIASDWLFWVETALNGSIGYIDVVLGRYRRGEASVTIKPAGQHRLFEDHLISCIILLARHPIYASELTWLMARHCMSLARRNHGLARAALFVVAPTLVAISVLTLPIAVLRKHYRRAAKSRCGNIHTIETQPD